MDQDQINDLIYKYESDLVKIRYQEEKINDIIAELRIMKKKSKDFIIEETVEKINHKSEEITVPVKNNKMNKPIKHDESEDMVDDSYNPPDWYFENEEEKEKFFQRRNEQPFNEATLLKNKPLVVSETEVVDAKKKDIFTEDENNLSDWDRFLINMLKFGETMVSRSEIFYMARIYTDQKNMCLTDDQIKEKIDESMTKLLENSKYGVIKYGSPDQGDVYCLSDDFKEE